MRILNVVAFAVSGYASTTGRTCKPFNPLLGETYEAAYPDKGIRFISEKVYLSLLLRSDDGEENLFIVTKIFTSFHQSIK